MCDIVYGWTRSDKEKDSVIRCDRVEGGGAHSLDCNCQCNLRNPEDTLITSEEDFVLSILVQRLILAFKRRHFILTE